MKEIIVLLQVGTSDQSNRRTGSLEGTLVGNDHRKFVILFV
jgi:hypothetical protein